MEKHYSSGDEPGTTTLPHNQIFNGAGTYAEAWKLAAVIAADPGDDPDQFVSERVLKIAERAADGKLTTADKRTIFTGKLTKAERRLLNRALRRRERRKAAAKRNVLISLAELDKKEFPPQKYVVSKLLPSGLLQVAAEPKVGKTWFGLQVGLGCAIGKPVLGGHYAERRNVLYLALEDGDRRIKFRTRQLLKEGFGGADMPANFHVMFAVPNGSVDDIEDKIDQIKEDHGQDVDLVIIDTWTSFKKLFTGRDIWKHESDQWGKLRTLSDAGIDVLVMNHLVKSNGEDVSLANRIAGSNSGRAATDGNLILDREQHEPKGILRREMRDTASSPLGLHFAGALWTVTDDLPIVEGSDVAKAIAAHVRETRKAGGVPLRQEVIKAVVAKDPKRFKEGAVAKAISRMLKPEGDSEPTLAYDSTDRGLIHLLDADLDTVDMAEQTMHEQHDD